MKNILGVIAMLFFVNLYAQNNAEAIKLEKQILQKAKDYSDPISIKNSMLNLIVLEGDQSKYKDSLALLYYAERKYGSCFVITQEILKNKPNDVKTLELQSFSLEALGAYDKAAESFAKLFAQSNDNYHGFSLANLQVHGFQFPFRRLTSFLRSITMEASSSTEMSGRSDWGSGNSTLINAFVDHISSTSSASTS